MSLKRKRSVLSIKDKNEDAGDIVFQMICKIVVSPLNVVFLISFARFCSSLILIFSIIRTLDYPDYFVWSHRVRIIEVRLYLVSGQGRKAKPRSRVRVETYDVR